MNDLHTGIDIITNLYQNITAEEGAIETYSDIELFTRDRDVVTNKRIKEILADEQEHLQALKDLVADIESTIDKCKPITSCPQVNCEEPWSGCSDPSVPVINPNIDAVR